MLQSQKRLEILKKTALGEKVGVDNLRLVYWSDDHVKLKLFQQGKVEGDYKTYLKTVPVRIRVYYLSNKNYQEESVPIDGHAVFVYTPKAK